MLKHYLKVFYHNLFRQKVITLINIVGLAIGMAVFVLVSLYVKEEYSHEAQWTNADRIVRTTISLKFNATTGFEVEDVTSLALAQLQEFFPREIEAGSRVYTTGQIIVVNEEELPGSINFVDPGFLDIFNIEEVSGNLQATMATQGQIALEVERAGALFSGSPLGQTLTLKLDDGTKKDFEVSAIYRLPEGVGKLKFSNLSLLTESLVRGESQPLTNATVDSDWFNGIDVKTYLLLGEPDDVERINARSEEFVEQYVRLPWVGEDTSITDSFALRVQLIRDMYFNPLPTEEGGSRLTANSFALVAVLVLLIAITNFVVLSVARSAERIGEVGVRKANGAFSLQLQGQFLLESLLQVTLAFGIAMALYELLRPLFEMLMQTELSTQIFSTECFFPGLALIVIVTLLGGLYPAFVLASIKPEGALKSGGSSLMGSMVLRKVLVCFQFTIAIALIVSTLVIYQQLSYVQNRDPGFSADKVVSLALFSESARKKGTVLMNKISEIQGVDLVTPASRMANSINGATQMTTLSMERGSDETAELFSYNVGYDFFSLYAMEILAGRSFLYERDPLIDSSQLSDEESRAFINKVVLNESAVRNFGFTSIASSVGELLFAEFRVEDNDIRYSQYEIIGVVADSQFDSLRAAPKGEMYLLSGSENWLLSFRVTEEAMASVRSQVEEMWQEVIAIGNPGIIFGRDIIAQEFSREKNEGLLLSGFALLAILVSCMGLYGLVAFDTTRRTKEIGVRKVLGSKQGSIQYLFLRQYLWPMLLANIIAWPVAIWAIQYWLERFPYQISQWVFIPVCIAAGVIVILIAVSTLSATVAGVCRVRPAQALRYE